MYVNTYLVVSNETPIHSNMKNNMLTMMPYINYYGLAQAGNELFVELPTVIGHI